MSHLHCERLPAREEIVMPIIATVTLVLFGLCSIIPAARAEPAKRLQAVSGSTTSLHEKLFREDMQD